MVAQLELTGKTSLRLWKPACSKSFKDDNEVLGDKNDSDVGNSQKGQMSYQEYRCFKRQRELCLLGISNRRKKYLSDSNYLVVKLCYLWRGVSVGQVYGTLVQQDRYYTKFQ